jgi:hypothetical protein
MFLDPDDGAQRSVLYQLSLIGSINIPMLLFKIGIDVPGVPLLGLVGKNSGCSPHSADGLWLEAHIGHLDSHRGTRRTYRSANHPQVAD